MKDAAKGLHLRGWRPPSIAKELVRLFPDAARWPDARTIQEWRKKWAPDQSGPWAFSDVGDLGVLLPVLHAILEETEGKVDSLTTAEAEVVTTLGRAITGMPPLGMYNWAQAMIAARARKESVDPLLHYLCYRPWEDNGERYLAAADKGLIKEVRSFCPGDSQWMPLDRRRIHRAFPLDAILALPQP